MQRSLLRCIFNFYYFQVYMSSSGLNWEPLLLAWVNKRSPTEIAIIKPLFGEVFPSLWTWTQQNLSFAMPVLEINVVIQVIFVFLLKTFPMKDLNTRVQAMKVENNPARS